MSKRTFALIGLFGALDDWSRFGPGGANTRRPRLRRPLSSIRPNFQQGGRSGPADTPVRARGTLAPPPSAIASRSAPTVVQRKRDADDDDVQTAKKTPARGGDRKRPRRRARRTRASSPSAPLRTRPRR